MLHQGLISVELVSPPRRPSPQLISEWGQFVSACPSVHLEQLWEWGEIRHIDGWQTALFVVRQDAAIIAGALILLRRVKGVMKIGYVCRGPLMKQCSEEDEVVLAERVVTELCRRVRQLHISYLVVAPPYHAGRLPEFLRAAGFFSHLPRMPPTGLMTGALLINLQCSEDDLLKGLRRTLRQDIGKAERGGATVREGDERDIELLWELMNDLCKRRGTRSNVSDIEVMRRLWQALRPSERVRIDVAEVAGRPVAALMTVCMGAWAIPWRIGWAGDQQKLSPEKILYWHVLCAVRARGCSIFDFNWVDTAEVAAIRAGTVPPPSQNTGITFFKLGFGGNVIPLAETVDYIPNPVLRLGLRWLR